MIKASDASSRCLYPRQVWYDHRPPPRLITEANPGLRGLGVRTVAELATAAPDPVTCVPHLKGAEKERRSVLQ